MPSSPSRGRSSRDRRTLPPSRQGEAIQCQFCPGQQFRRSRLSADDIQHLLLLRYPVRCVRCGQRQYSSVTVAALSLSSRTRHPRAKRDVSGEKNWTEPAGRMVLGKSAKDDPPKTIDRSAAQ